MTVEFNWRGDLCELGMKPLYLALSILPAAGLLLGCGEKNPAAGHSHSHGQGHSHDHGDGELPMEAVTVWGRRHEIFAEHPPLIAGEEAKFAVHVTELSTFEPRRVGAIVFRMTSGEAPPAEHVANEPARPGIYTSALTFPRAGEWNITVLVPDGEGQDEVRWPPVTVHASAEVAANAPQSGEIEAGGGIAVLKEQQWQLGIRTAPVELRQMAERIQVPGVTRAKPGLSATIRAPLAGQLETAEGFVPQPGAEVQAGQVLAFLRPHFSDAAAQFVAMEAEAGRAEAELKQAQSAFDRVQKLAAAQARSQREVQEAEAALASARARFEAAGSLRATYSSSRTNGLGAPVLELRAPIAGILVLAAAGSGETVAAEQALFTVLDPRTLWIEASATEAAAARLREPAGAICEVLDGSGRTFAIDRAGGKLLFGGLQLEPLTRTVPLLYEISNGEPRLRVGQSVRLHVEAAQPVEALAVPYSSLVEEGGMFVAYVQKSGEGFERRELTLGIRDGNWVQAIGGLAAGERVVTQGAYFVRLAGNSTAIPAHGHEH